MKSAGCGQANRQMLPLQPVPLFQVLRAHQTELKPLPSPWLKRWEDLETQHRESAISNMLGRGR